MRACLLYILFFVFISLALSCRPKNCTIPTTLTPTEILVSHSWEIQELYEVVNDNGTTHYLRGGENTTPDSDPDTIRYAFKADGSGTYRDSSGQVDSMTWAPVTSSLSQIHMSYIH